MPNEIVLATPLNANKHSQAMVQVIREELARIDPAKFLVYLFDVVDEVFLDLLAEQFDMLGYSGWVLAQNADQKRELLKSAFELHAMKGTPGGIKEAVRRLGFPGIEVEENTGAPEGALYPWAYFNVAYVIPDDRAIDALEISNMLGLIEKYKNARSVLNELKFRPNSNDYFQMRGEATFKVYNATTNALISSDTVSNWIHPRWLNLFFDNIRAKTQTERDSLADYRFEKIAFGTNGAVQHPVYSVDPFTITNAFTKALANNFEKPIGAIGIDRSQVSSGGSVLERANMRHYFRLEANEMNGQTIREAGMYMVNLNTDDAPGNPDILVCRVNRAPIVKTSAIYIEGYWDIFLYPNINPEP